MQIISSLLQVSKSIHVQTISDTSTRDIGLMFQVLCRNKLFENQKGKESLISRKLEPFELLC